MAGSFIYPRTVSVRRPVPSSGFGAIAYQGTLSDNETVILSGLRASIQEKGKASRMDLALPADTEGGANWSIFIPDATNGQIQNRDVIVDELGNRYQVGAAYWNSLGYRCRCKQLEA